MKRTVFTLILLTITALPSFRPSVALAAPTDTSGPWGIDIATFTNLSTAKRSPVTAGKVMVITKPMACNNLTIQADRPIKIMPGGEINVASGKTITINSQLSAGRRHIFKGAGRVILGTTNKSLTPKVFPQWWGTVPDDMATDDTPTFQKMLDDIGPTGQAIIDMGEGVYSFTSLNMTGFQGGIFFKGAGSVKTYIRLISATGNVFNLTNSRFNRFSDLGFTPHAGAPRTTGAVFYLGEGSSSNTFENLRLGTAYDGFYLYKSGGNTFRVIDGLDYASHRWHNMFTIEGASASNWFYRCGLATQQNANAAFEFRQAADLTGPDTNVLTECYAQKKGSNYIAYGVRANYGEFYHLKNCFFELGSAGGVGLSLEGASNVTSTDSHYTVCKNGVKITGGENISITGGRVYYNGEHGVNIAGGTGIKINDVQITDNGFLATNTWDQVHVAANVSAFDVSNNRIGKLKADAILPRYGIYVAPGRSDKYILGPNLISDFGTAAVYDGGYMGTAAQGGGNKIVHGNTGATEDVYQRHAAGQTTDATPTTLWSKTLEDRVAYYITARVINQYSSGGGNTDAYTRSVLVYRAGGGAAIVGAVAATETMEANAGHDCTFTVSGNDVQLVATGAAGTTIHWSANVQMISQMDATGYGALP